MFESIIGQCLCWIIIILVPNLIVRINCLFGNYLFTDLKFNIYNKKIYTTNINYWVPTYFLIPLVGSVAGTKLTHIYNSNVIPCKNY